MARGCRRIRPSTITSTTAFDTFSFDGTTCKGESAEAVRQPVRRVTTVIQDVLGNFEDAIGESLWRER